MHTSVSSASRSGSVAATLRLIFPIKNNPFKQSNRESLKGISLLFDPFLDFWLTVTRFQSSSTVVIRLNPDPKEAADGERPCFPGHSAVVGDSESEVGFCDLEALI